MTPDDLKPLRIEWAKKRDDGRWWDYEWKPRLTTSGINFIAAYREANEYDIEDMIEDGYIHRLPDGFRNLTTHWRVVWAGNGIDDECIPMAQFNEQALRTMLHQKMCLLRLHEAALKRLYEDHLLSHVGADYYDAYTQGYDILGRT